MNYPSEGAGTLALLHVDAQVIVVDKPSGLLSVPGRGPAKQDCASARVQRHVPDALVVHRLDQATSGLLLFARGTAMQRACSRLFEQRQVGKRYVAVVAGRLEPPTTPDGWDCIDLPLAADWPNRPRQIVERERGRPSRTRWRVLSFDPAQDTTRVELEPLTGRSHQLRVHLQAIGHPIGGDQLYAPEAVRRIAPRLLLHASELSLIHPASGETMLWRSAPPF